MANTITQAELIWFANEGLMTLHDAMGMARSVHRGFSEEAGFRGKTIRIHKPDSPTINNFGTGAQDANDSGVDIVLSNHKEAHWRFTDSELFFSRRGVLLNSHIRPAMKELAGAIEDDLTDLYIDIPYRYDVTTTAADVRKNVTQPRKILAANGVPINDRGNMFFAMDENLDAIFRESTMFDFDKLGPEAAARMQVGAASNMYQGIEFFYTGKIEEHTSGTVLSAGNDVLAAVNNGGGYAADVTSMAIDGLNGTETLLIGDSFSIAGQTTRYVLTANTTLAAGAGTITFAPGLSAAVADNAVVTFDDGNVAGNNADNFYANLLYHRNAFALAMAPLEGDVASEQARAQGWVVANVVDPETNLGLRLMVWYDGNGINLRLDALWGVKTLDEKMACRVLGDV